MPCNVTLVEPAGTTTRPGAEATLGEDEISYTGAPPTCSMPERCTVPVEDPPPTTVE